MVRVPSLRSSTSPKPVDRGATDREIAHWTDRFEGHPDACFDVRLSVTGFEATLKGRWQDDMDAADTDAPVETHWQASVRMASPASCRISGFYPDVLLLDGNAWPGCPGPSNALTRPITLLATMLGGLAPDSDVLTPVHRSSALIGMHLHRIADSSALEIAQLFSADHMMRWFVYESCTNDSTGRVAQLAYSCPGLLILAKALRDNRGQGASEDILDAVIKGRPLRVVLDLAVELWAATRHRVVGARSDREADALQRIDDAFSNGEPPRRVVMEIRQLLAWGSNTRHGFVPWNLANQRLRIKRAGRSVAPWAIWRPPLTAMVPEDVPTTEQANATWYACTATESLINRKNSRLHKAQRRSLDLFVSRHWHVLHSFAAEAETAFDEVIRDLVAYVGATGRCPSRKSSPKRIVEEALDWHQGHHGRDVEETPPPMVWPLPIPPAMTAPALPTPREPTPSPPPSAAPAIDLGPTMNEQLAFGDWADDEFEVHQLRTQRDFEQESELMDNCVEHYFDDAMGGDCAFFHADLAGKPATVEVTVNEDGYRVSQAKGRRNARLSTKYHARLRRWVKNLPHPGESR